MHVGVGSTRSVRRIIVGADGSVLSAKLVGSHYYCSLYLSVQFINMSPLCVIDQKIISK